MSNFASIVAKYLSGFIMENERKELEERLKKSEAERKLFEEIVLKGNFLRRLLVESFLLTIIGNMLLWMWKRLFGSSIAVRAEGH